MRETEKEEEEEVQGSHKRSSYCIKDYPSIRKFFPHLPGIFVIKNPRRRSIGNGGYRVHNTKIFGNAYVNIEVIDGLTFRSNLGIDYDNIDPILTMAPIEELNIGFSIVARAVFCGLAQAVSEMKTCMQRKGVSSC